MKRNRILTVAVLAGVVVALVTFVGAARMSGEDGKNGKDSAKTLSPVKTGSRGVIVYGNFDVDNGVGLVPLYPETFPQPSKVIAPKAGEHYPKDGEGVKKGQVLARFDSKLADLAVEEARAGLNQAKAAVERAAAAMTLANQALEGHQVLIDTTRKTLESKQAELDGAKKDLEEARIKLNKFGAQNDPELRSAQTKIDVATKALAAERVKLAGLENIRPVSKRSEAKAASDEAKAAVAKQQIVLEKAEYAQSMMVLTAPADGKIVRSMIAEGLTFGPQTRQPAFLFQPNGPLIVRSEVDQEFASRIALGEDAVITDDGNPNLKWTGKVIRIADSFLPKRTAAGVPEGLALNEQKVLECVISVEGGDQSVPIRVGQRVKVAIGVE